MAMRKYFYRKSKKGIYDIFHKDSVQGEETWIASTDTAEKADFLCKAANEFKYE